MSCDMSCLSCCGRASNPSSAPAPEVAPDPVITKPRATFIASQTNKAMLGVTPGVRADTLLRNMTELAEAERSAPEGQSVWGYVIVQAPRAPGRNA